MFLSIFGTVLLSAFSQPSLAYFIFQSKYPAVQPVIEGCRAMWPNVKALCAQMLRCTIDGVVSDYPARWSAGASILAFIPTIVGLISNSIDEITAIAEQSIFLAITISLSSVTVFSTRLGNHLTAAKPSYQDARPEDLQTARDSILERIKQNKQKHSRGWRNGRLQDAFIGIAMIGTSTIIWYELFQVMRYGIVTFTCPVKANVFMWAALGQTLTLLNICLRHYSFVCRKIHLQANSGARQTPNEPLRNSTETDSPVETVAIVLRDPRSGWQRRTLQFFTAVLSLSFYTLGTIVLASITLFKAADTLRVVVVVAVNAGFGRVVGYWAISSVRKGKKLILVDVSVAYVGNLFGNRLLKKSSGGVIGFHGWL